jgi:hypothetical protein
MIGTIRKHSKWLWVVIITVTIITFVFWMNPGGRNAGGGGATGNYGSIDGQKVAADAFWAAKNEVNLYYWFRTLRWPDRDPNFSERDWQIEIYRRLFLIYEGEKLGIHVGDDAVATAAREILSSPTLEREFGLNGEGVPLDAFVKNVLQPKGLTAGDFENFVRHELVMDQVRQAMGLAGALVTPQEIVAMYQHEFQERSAQIVFFSASNYLSSVPVTPDAVGQFYTNYLAEYRLPDRVIVSYVAFSVTNFMTEAEHQLTNLNDQVNAIYNRYGTNAVPEAKTPEEARSKIRGLLLRQQALADARQHAYDFANTVFNLEPVRPENLAAVAKQKGLAVRVTAPFSREYGPEEITNAPPDFTKTAFGLTPDAPLAEPIVGPDAVYVIALDKQLPSEIPALSQIYDRVARDYQLHEATSAAQTAGTNFVLKLQIGLATGKTFSAVCGSAGLRPETLPPFSLSTTELPELGDRATLDQLKSAAFGTPIGHASDFVATDDGGFIVFVKSELPLDASDMDANLPQFAAELRQQRETAAFYNWFARAASRALRDTPIAPGQSGNPAP